MLQAWMNTINCILWTGFVRLCVEEWQGKAYSRCTKFDLGKNLESHIPVTEQHRKCT